jgi:hypothetical protein
MLVASWPFTPVHDGARSPTKRTDRISGHYDIEVFHNQRRRYSTLGQSSPATFERRATQTA